MFPNEIVITHEDIIITWGAENFFVTTFSLAWRLITLPSLQDLTKLTLVLLVGIIVEERNLKNLSNTQNQVLILKSKCYLVYYDYHDYFLGASYPFAVVVVVRMGVVTGPEYKMTKNFMQKSKSSSSVLPLYGSSGSVSGAGPGSSTAHLRASPSGSVERAGDHPAQGASESGGGGGIGGAAAATSSSSGSRLISKSKLFKSRSKSSTRATTSSSGSAICTWSPQGRCKWKSVTGKVVNLEPTNVLNLSDVERLTLQDVALEKLRALNLGVDVKIPKEKVGGGQQKPKRRPYLLKKKALSTGFFESGSKREDAKDSTGGGGSGLVFGISLSQCVANDRLRQMKTAAVSSSSPVSADWEQPHKRSQNGSRNSVSSVFEMPKEDKEQLQSPQMSVPAIVSACINHLESYGLHTTGIFRVSTSLKRIRQLREIIDSGKEIQFGEDHSPHDVAALLKEFLRDLPEPLLCRDLYQAFLKTQKIRNRKLQLEAIQHLVQLLPVSNRDTLASLLKFFAKVVANACETRSKTGELLPGNKMEGYSLATLIAPNILPCMPTEGAVAASMDQNAALTKERRESIDLVNYMISNYTLIFDVTAELLHDVYLHLMDTNPDAIEGILKQRSGISDDVNDELETTSSVFEESESGELLEPEEMVTKVYRKREDILHEGAGKGGGYPEHFREDRTRERSRMKREESKERLMMGGNTGASHSGDVEKQHSGGESDTSSTRSTSRWFRRSRGDAKGRTSSDSGSEKVKGSRKRDSSLYESKRASSLDSVNVQEPGGAVRVSSRTTVDMIPSRPLSGSEQSLRVPEHLNRRQSSPVLESSGVITASLKIPVPVPLNIDDSDIPYIEDEHLEGATHHLHHHHQYIHHQPKYPQQHSHHHHVVHHHDIVKSVDTGQPTALSHLPSASTSSMSAARCRSMSTDSSMPLITTSSSVNTTPISSPARQPSSEVSSPTGFSPPTSPLLYGTFPVEEMTARMLIGSAPPITSSTPSTVGAITSTPSIHQFHHHYQQAPTLGAVTTTPSSSHHYPAMSKDIVESKSAGSTPTTRPKIEKPLSSSVASATTTAKKSSGTASGGMNSPHLIHKSGTSSTPPGAIASLGVATPKYGDIGTKSAPPSPQPPSSLNTLSNAPSPSSTSPVPSTSAGATPSSAIILPAGEPKGLGKETKGANIGGLIKSKTADFEKLTKVVPTEAELFSGAQPTQIYSIAPKMRLRSQENVLLKQQFLLRQQQHHQADRQREASGRGSATGTPTSTQKSEQHHGEQEESSSQSGASGSGTTVSSSPSGRSITRRRLVGSSSTSAIVSGNKPAGGGSSSTSTHRVRSTQPATTKEPEAGPSTGTPGLEAKKEPVPISGSSPSRWKRSEIIASRQQSQPTNDPETFV
ncbi:unnamed protein product [Orchesella dallaii]|uniref:Rho-GAP domain-containing protein n=1 Tax=Orchesella dallaii TaxID=48710 RepID=A0ABP1RSY2_9HEXA